jgi:hypothetical protein
MRSKIAFALLLGLALTLAPAASAAPLDGAFARHAVAAWDSLADWFAGWFAKEGVSLDPLGRKTGPGILPDGKSSSAYDPNGKLGTQLNPDGKPAGAGTDPDGYFHGPEISIDG